MAPGGYDTLVTLTPIDRVKLENENESKDGSQGKSKHSKYSPYGMKINVQNKDELYSGIFDYIRNDNLDEGAENKKLSRLNALKQFNFRADAEAELAIESSKPIQQDHDEIQYRCFDNGSQKLVKFNTFKLNEDTTMTVQFLKDLNTKKQYLKDNYRLMNGLLTEEITSPKGNVACKDMRFSTPIIYQPKEKSVKKKCERCEHAVKKSSVKSYSLTKVVIDIEKVVTPVKDVKSNEEKLVPSDQTGDNETDGSQIIKQDDRSIKSFDNQSRETAEQGIGADQQNKQKTPVSKITSNDTRNKDLPKLKFSPTSKSDNKGDKVALLQKENEPLLFESIEQYQLNKATKALENIHPDTQYQLHNPVTSSKNPTKSTLSLTALSTERTSRSLALRKPIYDINNISLDRCSKSRYGNQIRCRSKKSCCNFGSCFSIRRTHHTESSERNKSFINEKRLL